VPRIGHDGRTTAAVCGWLTLRSAEFRDAVQVVVIDPHAGYARAVRELLPHAALAVDHFHLVLLANKAVTAVRQRVTRDDPARTTRDREDPLAIGLGVKATQASYSVLFDTASNWITRLAAHQSGHLEAELKKIRRYKLIIIDEVGYIPFDHDAANLFFQLIASRYEQGSVIVTSNLPFGRWGEVFGDEIVAAAMIDRLVHHAEVLTLSGDSYRTRARRELLAKDRDN